MLKRFVATLMFVLLVVGVGVAMPAHEVDSRVVIYLFADASCSSGVGAVVAIYNDTTGALEGALRGCVEF